MTRPERAQHAITDASQEACDNINKFSFDVLNTRGGRIGSGMGGLLEALWGYNINQVLKGMSQDAAGLELAWMYGHEYNDFACVIRDGDWDPATRKGELLRIETKSMVSSADESKAHFDELYDRLEPFDLLAVLIWDWSPVDNIRIYPKILDQFIGAARSIAILRDVLHVARGGSFVNGSNCPDRCDPNSCAHAGEPLNASGKRERLSGPENTRVSSRVSYAANFGGMVRMLKTGSDDSRKKLRELRKKDDNVHQYISFIHRNLPEEEFNQYTAVEWRKVANMLGSTELPSNKNALVKLIRENYPDYQDYLRKL